MLDHLKYTQCPVCGAKVAQDELMFARGQLDEYLGTQSVPNDGKE